MRNACHVACIYEYNFSLASTINNVDTDVDIIHFASTGFVETMLSVQDIPTVEHQSDMQRNECISMVPISATAATINTCDVALRAFCEEHFSTPHVISDVKDKIGFYPIDANLVMSIPQPQLYDHNKVQDRGSTDVVDGTAFIAGNYTMARPK